MKRLFILTFILSAIYLCPVVSAEVHIIDMPVEWNDQRETLTRAYSQLHDGMDITQIVPQAVIVHWTDANTWESTYNYFHSPAREDGTLNVSSQFLVDRDGTIYRLMPETALARHAIGYNWCAIGIENVGGVNNAEDLTPEQLHANVELIRYLHHKYSGIQYVFGHYQQVTARTTGLYIEHVKGYHSIKSDPGPTFMMQLRSNLAHDGLTFFPE